MKRPVVSRRVLACSSVIIFVSALLAGWLVYRHHHANPFPADIRQYNSTPLYYPAKLPPGFTVNSDSFAQRQSVVLFSFDAPDDNKLHFTIEKAPAGYNFNKLYASTMEDTKAVTVPLGTVHIGTLGDNTMASLVVDDVWVMAVYSQPGANDDLTSIMKSLKPYK